jgi:hypothetical protein
MGNDSNLHKLSPSARIVFGTPDLQSHLRDVLAHAKWLAKREFILVEFDQNDQVSWSFPRTKTRRSPSISVCGTCFDEPGTASTDRRVGRAVARRLARQRPDPAAGSRSLPTSDGRSRRSRSGSRSSGHVPALLAMIDIRPGDPLTPEAWRRVSRAPGSGAAVRRCQRQVRGAWRECGVDLRIWCPGIRLRM